MNQINLDRNRIFDGSVEFPQLQPVEVINEICVAYPQCELTGEVQSLKNAVN